MYCQLLNRELQNMRHITLPWKMKQAKQLLSLAQVRKVQFNQKFDFIRLLITTLQIEALVTFTNMVATYPYVIKKQKKNHSSILLL